MIYFFGMEVEPLLSVMALFTGALIALSVLCNGDLAAVYGNYPSTVFVHLSGLAVIVLCILIRRERLKLDRTMPWMYYMGGVMGVATVVLGNVTYAALGVSVTVALQLLGQVLMSCMVDQFGLFHSQRRPLGWRQGIAIALIAGGIVVMILW